MNIVAPTPGITAQIATAIDSFPTHWADRIRAFPGRIIAVMPNDKLTNYRPEERTRPGQLVHGLFCPHPTDSQLYLCNWLSAAQTTHTLTHELSHVVDHLLVAQIPDAPTSYWSENDPEYLRITDALHARGRASTRYGLRDGCECFAETLALLVESTDSSQRARRRMPDLCAYLDRAVLAPPALVSVIL